jgi:hypothetical protein
MVEGEWIGLPDNAALVLARAQHVAETPIADGIDVGGMVSLDGLSVLELPL